MSTFLLHSGESDLHYLLKELRIPSGTQLPQPFGGAVVIHWGPFQPEWTATPVFQPIKAILRAAGKYKMRKQLRLHGIKTPDAGGLADEPETVQRYPYKYKIPVFHLEALTIFEKKEPVLYVSRRPLQQKLAAYVEMDLENNPTYHMRRAVREAVKAVYALGLDYGLVSVGILPNGHTLVLDVDPVPRLTRRLGSLYAEAMNRYDASLSKELLRTEPVVLGSDPEFLLLSLQGKVISASKYLEREGPVGCDAIILSGRRVILPLAELRPHPSSEPQELARNLQRTMRLAARKITDQSLAWLSGGMPLRGFPLGGHVHFSGCWLNSHLLRALDNYLALPLMLIEGATTCQRRPRYGFLGDFRKQPHGGFEYRTLPSWMATPAITKGVFALARLIADHYWKLKMQPLQELDIQTFYYQGEKKKVQKVVALLWADLEQLEGFPKYEPLLNPLKELIVRMEPWNELADFRREWKIPPFHEKRATYPQFMV